MECVNIDVGVLGSWDWEGACPMSVQSRRLYVLGLFWIGIIVAADSTSDSTNIINSTP